MAGFGHKLRQERESRDFTLAQVAEATRISLRYLEALESDNLSALPGSVFNKGYVRSFAKFIGADPEALIQAYIAEEEVQEREGRITRPDVLAGLAEAAERNPRRRRAPESRWTVPVLVLAAIALVALGGWSLFRFGSSSGKASPAVADQPPAAETTQVARASPPQRQPVEQPPSVRETRSSTPPAAEPATEPERTAPQESPSARQTPSSDPVPSSTPPPSTVDQVAGSQPSTPEPIAESRASIDDFGVGTGVVNRRLVGQSDRFDPGTRVWFWNRVIGANKGETIRHVWMHEGKTVSSFELALGGSHWRTQSRKTLRAPGRWAVEARDAQNRVLARTDFVCAKPS